MKRPDMLLWLSDARGVYIPRDFANSFSDRAKAVEGVSDEDWAILESGPDHEWYWDAWDNVTQDAVVIETDGTRYTLQQDGDLWLIPEGMEWNDETGTFDWPDERESEDEDADQD